MTSPKIRPATSADLDKFFGDGRPRASVRAIVVELDGDVVGVAALSYFNGQMVAVSQMDDVLRNYPLTIMKAAKRFTDILNRHGRNTFAVASDSEPRSAEFLDRLGFEYIGRTSAGRIYKWLTQ